MQIQGLDNITTQQLNAELKAGSRFVIFPYCVSVLIVSFKRSSGVYYVRKGESVFSKALPFSLVSLFLGWWGIPWGPIWTIATLYTNAMGGKDVTNQVVQALNSQPLPVAGSM